MPELPEVECLTRAVRGELVGGQLTKARFYRTDLRDPIPVREFRGLLEGEVVDQVFRRSKYMLIRGSAGFGVFHLGMSGTLYCLPEPKPQHPHTHAVFHCVRKDGRSVFFHFVDPRRFGRIACIPGPSFESHSWFEALGPEPLANADLGEHLYSQSRGRKQPVKPFLMDSRTVVGVGNIYASEALFRAGIHPGRKAGAVSRERYHRLARHIQKTLEEAIDAGGTTFRDFKNPDGNPGYFALSLRVYDREGVPCHACGKSVRMIRQSARATYYCPSCQK